MTSTPPAPEAEAGYTTARSIAAQSAARARDVIEQVPCPRCDAKSGVRCKTSGGWPTTTHLERRASAQNAGLWNPQESFVPQPRQPRNVTVAWRRWQGERRVYISARRGLVTTDALLTEDEARSLFAQLAALLAAAR